MLFDGPHHGGHTTDFVDDPDNVLGPRFANCEVRTVRELLRDEDGHVSRGDACENVKLEFAVDGTVVDSKCTANDGEASEVVPSSAVLSDHAVTITCHTDPSCADAGGLSETAIFEVSDVLRILTVGDAETCVANRGCGITWEYLGDPDACATVTILSLIHI